MITTGNLDAANYEITMDTSSAVTVQAWRDYPIGALPTTAQRVWQIVADFGGFKTIAPSVLSVYLTYPDATTTQIKTIRYMTFAPSNPGSPPSIGVEQLIELDEQARRLRYISVLGLPVDDYKSVMEVTGEDACRLTWTSSYKKNDSTPEHFPEILANILAGGLNQITVALGLE